jgi:hypothetical protein
MGYQDCSNCQALDLILPGGVYPWVYPRPKKAGPMKVTTNNSKLSGWLPALYFILFSDDWDGVFTEKI